LKQFDVLLTRLAAREVPLGKGTRYIPALEQFQIGHRRPPIDHACPSGLVEWYDGDCALLILLPWCKWTDQDRCSRTKGLWHDMTKVLTTSREGEQVMLSDDATYRVMRYGAHHDDRYVPGQPVNQLFAKAPVTSILYGAHDRQLN
jgi:hypothetical protein